MTRPLRIPPEPSALGNNAEESRDLFTNQEETGRMDDECRDGQAGGSNNSALTNNENSTLLLPDRQIIFKSAELIDSLKDNKTNHMLTSTPNSSNLSGMQDDPDKKSQEDQALQNSFFSSSPQDSGLISPNESNPIDEDTVSLFSNSSVRTDSMDENKGSPAKIIAEDPLPTLNDLSATPMDHDGNDHGMGGDSTDKTLSNLTSPQEGNCKVKTEAEAKEYNSFGFAPMLSTYCTGCYDKKNSFAIQVKETCDAMTSTRDDAITSTREAMTSTHNVAMTSTRDDVITSTCDAMTSTHDDAMTSTNAGNNEKSISHDLFPPVVEPLDTDQVNEIDGNHENSTSVFFDSLVRDVTFDDYIGSPVKRRSEGPLLTPKRQTPTSNENGPKYISMEQTQTNSPSLNLINKETLEEQAFIGRGDEAARPWRFVTDGEPNGEPIGNESAPKTTYRESEDLIVPKNKRKKSKKQKDSKKLKVTDIFDTPRSHHEAGAPVIQRRLRFFDDHDYEQPRVANRPPTPHPGPSRVFIETDANTTQDSNEALESPGGVNPYSVFGKIRATNVYNNNNVYNYYCSHEKK